MECISVAVSRGCDTRFSVRACDGLYQLLKSIGSDWNTITVSIDRVDHCQTHCKQVPEFSRPSGSDHITWVDLSQVNTRCYPPVHAFGSIWVVLWLLFFRSVPSMFPLQQVTLLGVCFQESLVFRLYSEIDQIHLCIEAQCGTACLPMGDCHNMNGLTSVLEILSQHFNNVNMSIKYSFLCHNLQADTSALSLAESTFKSFSALIQWWKQL